jgi:hypothetical protein
MRHPLGFEFDECDIDLVQSHRWHKNKSGHATYIRSTDTGEYLHRLILNAPKGMDVDHIDGNGMNCRRSNIREVTRSQNNMNRRSQRDGRKGIHLDSATGKWRAEIWADGKRIRSPRLNTEQEAISAREGMERLYHGDFAGIGTAA